MNSRIDDLDPLPRMSAMPNLMTDWGRVDVHTIVASFLVGNKISGAYLEFGVGIGRSAVSAIRAYTRANVCNRFVLFDSFCGLPSLEKVDEGSEQFKKGDYAFSQDEVINFLKGHQIELNDSVQFSPGWIEQSFKVWAAHNVQCVAAVVHIDVDLYSSCRDVLNDLLPFLQQGSVILFDDWNCFKASSKRGERRATQEWLHSNPNLQLHPYCAYGWHGQAFIVER